MDGLGRMAVVVKAGDRGHWGVEMDGGQMLL